MKLNHAELGFVQDAQGFVFLSGLLVGMVYARRLMKRGFAAGSGALWRRAAELYGYTIGCVLLLLTLRQALPGADRIWEPWLGGLGDGGPAFLAGGAALLYQPTYLDILPQYIVYLLVAPPLVWLCVTGRWLAVAVGSGILWFAVQTGLHLPVAAAINQGLGHIHPDLMLRVPFNVLAWQVLFVGAMVIGALWVQGRLDVGRIFDPRRTMLARACAALLVFFLAFRLGFTLDLVPEAVTMRFRQYENRAEFGPVFLINFLALGYVVAWLLIAGPRSPHGAVARTAALLSGVFNLPFLRLLGRHSLQIYAWHVVLIYLVLWLDRAVGPFDEIRKTAIAIAGVALLALPALYRERRSVLRSSAAAGQQAS